MFQSKSSEACLLLLRQGKKKAQHESDAQDTETDDRGIG
jgi:hypothetical protein